MQKFPEWVTEYIAEWKRRLYLQEWEIATVLSAHPNGDGSRETNACVELHLDVLQATLEIRDDIPASLDGVDPDTARDWKKIIVHELLHIRVARMITILTTDILPELAPQANSLTHRWLEHEEELLVQIMAQALIDLTEDG